MYKPTRQKRHWFKYLFRGSVALIFLATLGLNVLLVTSSTIFAAASGLVGGLTGIRDVYTRYDEGERAANKRIADLEAESDIAKTRTAELDRERASLANRNVELERERATLSARNKELLDDRAKLRDETTRLNRDLKTVKRDRMVTYRGQKTAVKEAVADSSARISNRVTRAAQRNIAATFAEGLPVFGIAVIVGATAWELNDTCELMKDLHELDVAFNPENAIEDREVCGLKVPTKEEIWQRILNSPGDVWESAKGTYSDLPDVSISGAYESVVGLGSRLYAKIAGDGDAEQETGN